MNRRVELVVSGVILAFPRLMERNFSRALIGGTDASPHALNLQRASKGLATNKRLTEEAGKKRAQDAACGFRFPPALQPPPAPRRYFMSSSRPIGRRATSRSVFGAAVAQLSISRLKVSQASLASWSGGTFERDFWKLEKEEGPMRPEKPTYQPCLDVIN